MAAIQLEHIRHAYGEKVVLEDLSLSVAARKITCLLGGTGSGKTTILRLIAGLERPQSGKIYIAGRTVTSEDGIKVPPARRRTGFVFQDLALWPHFTVWKNVTWGLKATGQKDAGAKAASILESFGLSGHEQKYPHQLSGGQQQLLAMARALAPGADILLMDEPLSGLDVRLRDRMMDHILKVRSTFDVTVVYVTHDHREAFYLADDIVVLNDGGRVEATGGKEAVAKSDNAFVKDFIRLPGSPA